MTFAEQVYSACKKIPVGRVTTYKLLADAIGTKSYRAVGTALKNNPFAPFVPCHRVIKSDMTIGGFKGKMCGIEIEEKKRLLEEEGVVIEKYCIDKKYLYSF